MNATPLNDDDGRDHIPDADAAEPQYVGDVVPAKVVVDTLRVSVKACLTAAAARDGVELSETQIERFARECANNAAQTILLIGLEKANGR